MTRRDVHPIVTTLLGLAFGAGGFAGLAGCKTVCHRPIATSTLPLDSMPPDDIATLFASSDLRAVTRVLPTKTCDEICGRKTTQCEVALAPEGPPERPVMMSGTVTCSFIGEEVCSTGGGGGGFDPFKLNSCPFGCGRRPAVEASVAARADPLVHHFAQIAMLEALSVGAFRQLARDVRDHAPAFAARVSRAARDEQRHARRARGVLRRLGAEADTVPHVPVATRPLDELTMNNAVEGCVRETFGAISACIQAERAGDPTIRRFFRAIAHDELEHAALSWDLHRAFMARVEPGARTRIDCAQQRALAELESMEEPSPAVRAATGAPTRSEQRALVRAMAASLPFGCA